MVRLMTETALRILPNYDSADRPARLVRAADDAVNGLHVQGKGVEWPELVVLACDTMLAGGSRSRDPALPRGSRQRPTRAAPRASQSDLGTAMAGELLGNLVNRVSSVSLISQKCREAYPRCWDEALDEYAADPSLPGEPESILYDHSVPLSTAKGSGPPWPEGIYEACEAVERFAHLTGAYSSHGLGLAHVAPSPVVWPPLPVSNEVMGARRALRDALDGTLLSYEEHTAMVFAYLIARDNPDLPNPSQAETDQVNASLRDWGATVEPAARSLAAATYAHAWNWVSTDPERWDPGAINYAYAEAFLSVHNLSRATDTYDLADAACRSYAWWWCHDRKLDLDGLRELAASW